MDVFELRDRLIADYKDYVTSFMALRDPRIRERVETSLAEGRLWPETRVGLNPAFEPGAWVDDLVADPEIALHPDCARIFRVGKSAADPLGQPMRLHRHQVEAIRAARAGGNYVLTTGTGSGKSLAYLVPIVDLVLREGSGRGVRAIVVYPMNALANSQTNELNKFLRFGFSTPPVRFARYTGQEGIEERNAILNDPPDIVLTNYVMLELILTRVHDRRLTRSADDLRFLVLDELHTYRGRQGADVAMLARRTREACRATRLQCVGTSATLATQGNHSDQRAAIADIATTVFGSEVKPDDVIGETLRRATPDLDIEAPDALEALRTRLRDGHHDEAQDFESFVADPLSSWVESTFGVRRTGSDEQLARREPQPIKGPDGAAAPLSALTGIDVDRCAAAISRPSTPHPPTPRSPTSNPPAPTGPGQSEPCDE
jgi:ATP-dependent helicase YprA (DUF1998 family)